MPRLFDFPKLAMFIWLMCVWRFGFILAVQSLPHAVAWPYLDCTACLLTCLPVLHFRKCYSVKGHGHNSSTLPPQISFKRINTWTWKEMPSICGLRKLRSHWGVDLFTFTPIPILKLYILSFLMKLEAKRKSFLFKNKKFWRDFMRPTFFQMRQSIWWWCHQTL